MHTKRKKELLFESNNIKTGIELTNAKNEGQSATTINTKGVDNNTSNKGNGGNSMYTGNENLLNESDDDVIGGLRGTNIVRVASMTLGKSEGENQIVHTNQID